MDNPWSENSIYRNRAEAEEAMARAKADGVPRINIVLNDLIKFGIHIEDEKYYYNEISKFSFGKYKGVFLKLVYKCDPDYIEWCLINADSFCISEKAMNLFANVKRFLSQDLVAISVKKNIIQIDLRDLPLDKFGFPYSQSIREIEYVFSHKALESNKNKLNSKLNPFNVLKGR